MFYFHSFVEHMVSAAKKAGFAVEVVAYLPRQDLAIVAGYLQSVRNHRMSGTIEQYLAVSERVGRFHYLGVLSKMEEHSRPARLVVRTFNRRFLRGGSILNDFMEIVDPSLDLEAWEKPRPDTNNGLRLECYELLRALNRMERNDLARQLARLPVELDDADRLRSFSYYYTPQVRQHIVSRLMPENGELLRRYMPERSEEEAAFWREIEEPVAPAQFDSTKLADYLSRLIG